jgi:putative transposase
MDKYQNRYRISSVRLKNWDYGNPGMYFITICCKNRVSYFGRIISNKKETSATKPVDTNNHCNPVSVTTPCLQPTEMGRIAAEEWLKTARIRADMSIELGPFIVMPNHFHAILIIGSNAYNTHQAAGKVPDTGNRFAPQQKNLASVIRGYKSAVTSYANKNKIVFWWQANYYEHIIRSYQAFINISEYIDNNPAKWQHDIFYG